MDEMEAPLVSGASGNARSVPRRDYVQGTPKEEAKSGRWCSNLVVRGGATICAASLTAALNVPDKKIGTCANVSVLFVNLVLYWETLQTIGKSYEDKKLRVVLAICALPPAIFLSLDAFVGGWQEISHLNQGHKSKTLEVCLFALLIIMLVPFFVASHSLMMASLTQAYHWARGLWASLQNFGELNLNRWDAGRCILEIFFLGVGCISQESLMVSVKKGGWEALAPKSKDAVVSRIEYGVAKAFLIESIIVRVLLIFMRLLNLQETFPQLVRNFCNHLGGKRLSCDSSAFPNHKRCPKWLATIFMGILSLLSIAIIIGNGWANGQLAEYASSSQVKRVFDFLCNAGSSVVLCSAAFIKLALAAQFTKGVPAMQEDLSFCENGQFVAVLPDDFKRSGEESPCKARGRIEEDRRTATPASSQSSQLGSSSCLTELDYDPESSSRAGTPYGISRGDTSPVSPVSAVPKCFNGNNRGISPPPRVSAKPCLPSSSVQALQAVTWFDGERNLCRASSSVHALPTMDSVKEERSLQASPQSGPAPAPAGLPSPMLI